MHKESFRDVYHRFWLRFTLFSTFLRSNEGEGLKGGEQNLGTVAHPVLAGKRCRSELTRAGVRPSDSSGGCLAVNFSHIVP
jgi:hypothetical protein